MTKPEPHPDTGTMRDVTDRKTIRAYVDGLNSKVSIKAALILANLPEQPHPLLVDIGCMTGKVAYEVWTCRQDLRVEGIDANSSFIEEARATYPLLEFRVEDPSKGLTYEDGSVSAFSLSGVLHEILTYNDFSTEAVLTSLREMHRALRPGGRIIVREPAMPQQPHEPLRVTLSTATGTNPATDDLLLETIPGELSAHAQMRRFLLQFQPLRLPQNQHLNEQLLAHPDGSYELPAWLVGEFLRKRTFSDSQEHWNAEMGELNAPFTSDALAELAEAVGFSQEKVRTRDVFEADFYAEIKQDDGIRLSDEAGVPVNQSKRLPSHVYAVFERN